jgi:hypothetical protein
MKEIKLCIVLLVVVMISIVPTTTTTTTVFDVIDAISTIKGNILRRQSHQYDFCTELHSGGDKYACRIRNFEQYGFLFCKEYNNGHDTCTDIINREIHGFLQLRKEQVRIVPFYPHAITDVVCPDSEYEGDTRCSGFLEEWVDNGEAFHLRVYIDDHEVEKQTSKIIQRTKKEGLSTTREDLEKIYSYMANDGVNFRCICDLQGFYLLDGGFLVGDTEGIKENLGIGGACDKGEPTIREFLQSLEYIINKIKSAEPKKG